MGGPETHPVKALARLKRRVLGRQPRGPPADPEHDRALIRRALSTKLSARLIRDIGGGEE